MGDLGQGSLCQEKGLKSVSGCGPRWGVQGSLYFCDMQRVSRLWEALVLALRTAQGVCLWLRASGASDLSHITVSSSTALAILENAGFFAYLDFFAGCPCAELSGQPDLAANRNLPNPWATPEAQPSYLQSRVVTAHVAGDEAAFPNDGCIRLGLGSGFVMDLRLDGIGTQQRKKTHKKEHV